MTTGADNPNVLKGKELEIIPWEGQKVILHNLAHTAAVKDMKARGFLWQEKKEDGTPFYYFDFAYGTEEIFVSVLQGLDFTKWRREK